MKKPETGLKQGRFTESEKEAARARILGKLLERGASVEGTWREIRAELDLDDIHMKLFQRSCWHLKKGDREHGKQRIRVYRREAGGHGLRQPIVITAYADADL